MFSSIFQASNVWKELTWMYLVSPVYVLYISNAPRRKMRIFKTPRDISIYGRFRFSIIFCWRITTKHARVYRKAHSVTRYIFYWYIWNSTKKCAFLLLKTMKHRKKLSSRKMRVFSFEITSFHENHWMFFFFENIDQHSMFFVKTCYFRWKNVHSSTWKLLSMFHCFQE